jgi:hypothetical protein
MIISVRNDNSRKEIMAIEIQEAIGQWFGVSDPAPLDMDTARNAKYLKSVSLFKSCLYPLIQIRMEMWQRSGEAT